MNIQEMIDILIQQAILYLPKVILAVLTLIIGWWVIKLIVKIMTKMMNKRKIEVSLIQFSTNVFGTLLKVLLLLSVVSMFGVETTSFVAVIAALGLAIGFALQGTLANFAGGVLILLFKPFKVHDVIEGNGHLGKVTKITLVSTILKSFDNKTIIIPNGALANDSIINYSTEKERRVDFTFGIGYDDDIDKARKVIEEVIATKKEILKTPAPEILVGELGDSSVNFVVRTWCKGADYWDVHFYMIENVKKAFDKNKISIPFPQRDVHMYNH